MVLSFLSLLAKIKCDISPHQFNIRYASPVPPENLAYSWLGHSSKRRSNCTQTQHPGQNQQQTDPTQCV